MIANRRGRLFDFIVRIIFLLAVLNEPCWSQQYVLNRVKLELADGTLLKNVNNVRYHNGSVYIGGENGLLKVNARTFELESAVRYGPVADSPMCRYYPREECLYNKRKYSTNNYNKLLLILEKERALLSCWSANQGVCDVRRLDNLDELVVNSSVSVVANDAVNSTIGFMASSANSQRLFYVASTYTNLGAYRDDVPALAGRSLSAHKFMHLIESNNQLKTVKSSLEFVPRFRRSFIVKYVEGFNLGVHNYYLSVQHFDTDALLANQPLVTKLSRLCVNDLSFSKSYTEIQLRCTSGSRGSISSLRSVDYNELVSARLIRLDDEPHIVGLFQQSSRTTFNQSIADATGGVRQAVCVYPIRQIQAKILENINKCYNANPDAPPLMRGLNFIKPDQKCSYRKLNLVNDDYCSSSGENGLYPIGGTQLLVANSLIEFDTLSTVEKYNDQFDSLQFYSTNGGLVNVLVLMSNAQARIKFFHVRSLDQEPTVYRTVQLDAGDDSEYELTNPVVRVPVSNLEIERDERDDEEPRSLLVVARSRLYKVELDSCRLYKTCGACLAKSADGEPSCGWCAATNECTTRSVCSSSSSQYSSDNKWINSAQSDSMCVDVENVQPALKYKHDNDWIEISFRKQLTSASNSTETWQCVFQHAALEQSLTTDAVKIDGDKLKCSLPHSSRLQSVFAASTFEQQELELSADGLFKGSPANRYYYERMMDRVELGVYVQQANSAEVKYGTTGPDDRARFNVTLVDCNVHRSCVSCTGAGVQCRWCGDRCLNPAEEINPSSTCSSNDQPTCGSFDTGTSKLLIPYTAHRQQAPLMFTFLNIDPATVSRFESQPDSLRCMFTLFDGKHVGRNVTVPYAYLNATHGHCSLLSVFDVLAFAIEPTGQVQTNLRLYDSARDIFYDSNTNGKLALLFYKCELKASDCSECMSVNAQLSCMWCGSGGSSAATGVFFGTGPGSTPKSTCRFMNAHSKLAVLSQCISPALLAIANVNLTYYPQCDRPQIDLIEPAKLPIGGGTIVVIYGNNLGTKFDDLLDVHFSCAQDKVQIKCDLIEHKYVTSKQIWCESRPSLVGVQSGCRVVVKLKATSGTLGVTTGTSGEQFQITSGQPVDYVDPIINDIEPKTVIQSAKFVWLTIRGVDLDAGRYKQIQIIDYNTQPQQQLQLQQSTGATNRVLKCEIKNSTSKEIKCRINDKFETLGKKNLKLIFDKSMTVLNYLSLRVTSDPLVKSVDTRVALYAGGTSFRLSGFNFDSVQSVYTFVSYRGLWYSEPLQARGRLSNELIEFDYPPLNDAYFQLAKQQQQHNLQIGFLMDGFNITLKDSDVTYVPNFNDEQVSVRDVQITIGRSVNQTVGNVFSLVADLHLDPSLSQTVYSLVRSNLRIFVGCSVCSSPEWLNDTRILCKLPPLSMNTAESGASTCEPRVYSSLLGKVNARNDLSLLGIFAGNLELKQSGDFAAHNENLRIYLQTFMFYDVDQFLSVAQRLAAQTNSEGLKAILAENMNRREQLLKSGGDNFLMESLSGSSGRNSLSSRNLLLISIIIATLLIVLIVFTTVLISVVARIKRKHGTATGKLDGTMAVVTLSPTRRLLGKRAKSDKQMRAEFELIQKQIDLLELSIRPKCALAYQQLHQDYLNELNNDLIYNVNTVPVWNYNTYLLNLFAVDCSSIKQRCMLLSSSSMSNSTTNTLLSGQTKPVTPPAPPPPIPCQQQQQSSAQSAMSVYATIKSSSMLRFDALDNSDISAAAASKQQFMSYGYIGDAMLLFDQLIRNKNFLFTFLSVCERNSTAADRQTLASLLCLSLRDNLPYLYSIIKSLLSEHITRAFQTTSTGGRQPYHQRLRQTFRPTGDTNTSLVELLVVNWLSMFMYDFQRQTQCGVHFYRLVRVIRHYLAMAPCDQVKQLAVNSLSEERLLVEPATLQYQLVYVNVVLNQASVNQSRGFFVCPLVDLDTVQQAKEKIIDLIFKQSNLAQFGLTSRPRVNDIDLELCLLIVPNNESTQQTSTLITLKDTEGELISDNTSEAENRLLTLKDYNIQNGSFINLSFRPHLLAQQQQQQQQQHVYMSTMSMSNEYLLYASNTLVRNGSKNTKPSVPLPLTPPPSLTANRFHLIQQQTQPVLGQFSTTGSSGSNTSSMVSSSEGGKTLPTKKKKKKKYEKLLTVKSQDSAVTTASLITTRTDTTYDTANPTNRASVLTRLLMNKGTVQPFIDQFIEHIFLNTSNLPPVVQHLFEFLDQEVRKNLPADYANTNSGADDLNKLTRQWKCNLYFLRFWIKLIKSPENLFDVEKSPLVGASLNCIAQAFADSCSLVDSHNLYDTHSPTNRLLFIREVPRYKQLIENFFTELKSHQPVSDHELHFYLNEFSKCHPAATHYSTQMSGELSQVQVLQKLYSYHEKHEQEMNQALGQQQCSVLLPVHHRLVQIKDLISTSTTTTTTTTSGSSSSSTAATAAQCGHTTLHLPFNTQHPHTLKTLNHTSSINPLYLSQQYQPNAYATAGDLCNGAATLQTNLGHLTHQQFNNQQQQYF